MQREQEQATASVPALKRDWAAYGQGSGDTAPDGRGKQLCAVGVSSCSKQEMPTLLFPTSPTPPPFEAWASEYQFDAPDPDANTPLVFEEQTALHWHEDLFSTQLHISGASDPDQPMCEYDMPTTSSSTGTCDIAAQTRNRLTISSTSPTTDPSSATTPVSKVTNADGYYDMCFGMLPIILTSMASVQGDGNLALTEIEPSGKILKFTLVDSRTYLGALESSFLVRLVHEFAVTLEATVTIPKAAKGVAAARIRDLPLEIIVYGMRKDKKTVGDLLAEADLALQHPSEFDTAVEYDNPHYLVRPGSQMPRPDATHSDTTNRSITKVLHESVKAKLQQVFDLASGQGVICHAVQSHRIKTELKEHQLRALAFMLEKEQGSVEQPVYPSLWRPTSDEKGNKIYRHVITNMRGPSPLLPLKGGILADDMGLGKTVTTLALISSCLDSFNAVDAGVERATLIVAPKSVIPEWERQLKSHTASGQLRYHVYQSSSRSDNSAEILGHDVVLVTYDTLRSRWSTNSKHCGLYHVRWNRVVLDEAHRIRNRSSELFKSVSALQTHYRWCLTGTPIQNSLDDYAALVSFIQVPSLATKQQFDGWIAKPFKANTPLAMQNVQNLVQATCLRRTKAIVQASIRLPKRHERICKVDLSLKDRDLYDFFRTHAYVLAAGHLPPQSSSTAKANSRLNLLSLLNVLRRICDHGTQMIPSTALEAWKKRNRLVLGSIIMEEVRRCPSCNTEGLDEEECVTCSGAIAREFERAGAEGLTELPPRANYPTLLEPSSKLQSLLKNLEGRELDKNEKNKSVIFSFWTAMLDIVAILLRERNLCFQRIDGQTDLNQRNIALETFRSDPACTILLASIGSVGEGVDLTAACDVHILEPQWNPMAEDQAASRVHRIGQTQEVSITRYVTTNSIEEYIQLVQEQKRRLASQALGTRPISPQDVDEERSQKLLHCLES